MKLYKPLNKLLTAKKSDVAELITCARQLDHLSSIVQALLDPALSEHCQVGRFNGSCLVLVTDSPAWASRLRFSSTTLLTQLRKYSNKFHGLSKIDIKVSPKLPETQISPPKRVLSDQAAGCLEETALATENPALKEALQRLASRKSK